MRFRKLQWKWGLLLMMTATAITAKAQVTYNDAAELREAEMGVERVARNFIPTYRTIVKGEFDEPHWVQIDLGSRQRIDSIKLLPAVHIWGDRKRGFPSRFRIEVSDIEDFSQSVVYEDYNDLHSEDFPIPEDRVATFSSKQAYGRYVRVTALRFRNNRFALTKIMVMSGGKDVAVGCKATESHPSPDSEIEALTREPRPQGEFVVTDNPQNIIPEKQWKPVKNAVETLQGGVRLHDGLFKSTMQQNISYLLNSFTKDELVRNFRIKAGLPVESLPERLNNFWLTRIPGSEAGRFLMGAGNTLRWMENDALRQEMNDIIDVIDQCKEPDGYCMAFPKHTMFENEHGAYTRSWVTHGLIDAGYAGNEKAFQLLRGFYDWFDKSLYLPEMLRRCGQGVQGIIPLTRTYFSPVGKSDEIRVVQRYFQENYFIEQLAARQKEVIYKYPYDRPHNYLLTAIEPYMDLYRATGDEKYLHAVEGAWEMFRDNWEHIGGSMAINEGVYFYYEPKSYHLDKETGELCGSAFWIKLNQRFHQLYPQEEKYVGEIEKSIYNVAIANQYGAEGIRYFATLINHKDEPKVEHSYHAMSTCCEGQGTRILGSLPEYIYSVGKNEVYVNLFAASEIDVKWQKGNMTLKMATQFPYEKGVRLTVDSKQPLSGKICIRIPSWAASAVAVSVNGEKMGEGKPGTYFPIERTWNSGDEVTFTLPMDFRLTRYTGVTPGYEQDHYGIEYGPLLMALVGVKGKKTDMGVQATTDDFIRRLRPVKGKPLHFAVSGESEFEVWPYFEVEDQPMTCMPRIAN